VDCSGILLEQTHYGKAAEEGRVLHKRSESSGDGVVANVRF
jgi:hypothetical protein